VENNEQQIQKQNKFGWKNRKSYASIHNANDSQQNSDSEQQTLRRPEGSSKTKIKRPSNLPIKKSYNEGNNKTHKDYSKQELVTSGPQNYSNTAPKQLNGKPLVIECNRPRVPPQ